MRPSEAARLLAAAFVLGHGPPAAAEPVSERRLWGSWPDRAPTVLVLVAPALAWSEEPLAAAPSSVCDEQQQCARVRRLAAYHRRPCPTCLRPYTYGTLLELDRPLGVVGPYRDELDGAEVAGDAVLQTVDPPPDPPPPSEVDWDAGPVAGSPEELWSVEASGGVGLLAGDSVALGPGLRIGFRRYADYSDEAPLDHLGSPGVLLGLLSFGIIAIPYDAWFGNDSGLDLRARVLADADRARSPTTWTVGLAPALRVTPDEGRWRLPSVMGLLLPEVGVTVSGEHGVAPYVEVFRAPFGVWLGRHVGLDLEPGLWVGRTPWQPEELFPTVAVACEASLQVR